MKKILMVGLISSLFSVSVFAAACTATATTSAQAGPVGSTGTAPVTGEQCICDGGTAFKNTVHGGSGQVVNTPIFVKNGFDVQCSNNTIVSFDEVSSNAFAVESGSRKGNQSFIGSSNGGSVTTSVKCTGANSACTAADVTTAHTAAVAAATSS